MKLSLVVSTLMGVWCSVGALAQTKIEPRTEAPAVNERGGPSNDDCAGAFILQCNSTVNANLTGASTDPGDPVYSCRFGSPAQGVATVWYSFIAGNTSAHLITGPVSGGSASDTILAVYSGVCGSLTEIACNDDINYAGGNYYSEVNVGGLTPGVVYLVQVSAYGSGNIGTYSLRLDCPPPANDACAGAATISCNTYTQAHLSSATTAPGDPVFPCRVGGSSQGSGSVWFKFAASGPTARLLTESLTGGNARDTLLAVYAGTCANLVQIACNDDIDTGSGNFFSQLNLAGLTPGNTYYVEVAAWSSSALGSYGLVLECPGDCVACPSGSYAELEPCGGDTNGGCNTNPIAYEPIPCGVTYCGTWSYDGITRDTDWFSFTLDVPSTVSWCITSQVFSQSVILNTNCGLLDNQYGPACGQTCSSATLAPGMYVVFAAPDFGNSPFPCSDVGQWQATMTITPTCPGDFNNDGVVNTSDLALLLLRFGQAVSTCSALDFDHNGVVNTSDLANLLLRFGRSCAPVAPTVPREFDPALTGAVPGQTIAPAPTPVR